MADEQPLLELRNLKTWFYTDEGVAKAVDGVDYAILPGETLGLVGESGCGKSVTALSIMGLIPDPRTTSGYSTMTKVLTQEVWGLTRRRR